MDRDSANTPLRRSLLWSVPLILITMAAIAITTIHIVRHTLGPPPRVGIPHPLPHTGPSAIFNVETYGADPTGKHDSTVAIQKAISPAEQRPGSEVYFAPGTFILDQRSHKLFTFVIRRFISIVGSGIHNTTIIN